MATLVEILRKETTQLKKQYIEKTTQWAENYFNICKTRSKWFEVEWCKFFGIEPELANKGTSMEFLSYPKGFHSTKNARELHRYQTEIRSILNLGLDKFIQKEVKKAELHYENSILKLAERIEKKSLDINNLNIITSKLGINIEMTLTDGNKTVKAFTIVAEGEIQRPHYRYLVK